MTASTSASANYLNAGTLKLLDLTLKPSTSILTSLIGDFTGSSGKQQELAILRADGSIEIWATTSATAAEPGLRMLMSSGRTHSVLRSAVPVRLGGSKRDLIVVGSDSGCLSVLDFNMVAAGAAGEAGLRPKILHCPAFGKTGCRRETPGQYLAADPKGRAVMVAAIEKRKLVYVLNQTSSSEDNGNSGEPKVTIASPLEAHKSFTITFSLVGLDNGYDNPLFAALECTYNDYNDDFDDDDMNYTSNNGLDKQLAYYELDLGLNHVSRRWSTVVHSSASVLAAIPGGSDGPGGVLVGGEDWIQYVHEHQTNLIVAPIPRRKNHPTNKGILLTSITVHRQKKRKFFAIAQTELGDAFKITLHLNPENPAEVQGITVSLLDSLPIANSINITKSGMLFLAAEFSDHNLYQFERIDLDDAPSNSTAIGIKDIFECTTSRASELATVFDPSKKLESLRIINKMSSLAPATAVLVGELAGGEASPQIYTLCGRSELSSLRILRHGAAISELARSDLPGVPGGIFTIGSKYIIVSFADATLVLSIGATVEEVDDSGFLNNVPTLACSALVDGGYCQVHPSGVRHIRPNGQTKEWQCPGLKRIEVASVNSAQVIVALAGGEVVYFELDSLSGALTEASTKEMGVEVACLDVGIVPKGRSRSLFAAIGCRDQTCRVVTLAPDQLLAQRSSTALRARPHSVCLQLHEQDIFLTIGLDDGSAMRASLDSSSGAVGGPTRRFLGARPVGIVRATVNGQSCTLLLSSRPWISKSDPSGKYSTLPLSYVPLDHACLFNSDIIPEAIVATAGSTLRILSVEKANENFNQTRVKLRYTPRQMCLLGGNLAICEADHNDVGDSEKQKNDSSGKEDMDMEMDDDENGDVVEEEDEMKATYVRGPMPSEGGRWGSCVRLINPSSVETLDIIEMGENEAALSCCSAQFHSRGGETLLAVGSVTGMTLHPLKHKEAHISLYRVVNGRLQLLHKTPVEAPVLALAHFQGKLLCGVGNVLRLYEMGKKQLLRKTELRGIPRMVKTLQTVGDR